MRTATICFIMRSAPQETITAGPPRTGDDGQQRTQDAQKGTSPNEHLAVEEKANWSLCIISKSHWGAAPLQRHFLLIFDAVAWGPGRQEPEIDEDHDDSCHHCKQGASGLQKQRYLRFSINLNIDVGSSSVVVVVCCCNGERFCQACCCCCCCCAAAPNEGNAATSCCCGGRCSALLSGGERRSSFCLAVLIEFVRMAYKFVYQILRAYRKAKSTPVLQRGVVLVHKTIKLPALGLVRNFTTTRELKKRSLVRSCCCSSSADHLFLAALAIVSRESGSLRSVLPRQS